MHYDYLFEIWRDVIGYEGLYQVSNYGRVKSLNYHGGKKEKVLKPGKDRCGYLYVVLCKEGSHKKYKVHRLVAQAFIPNPNNYPCVNHKDENKTNNCVDNLEWCTYKYNTNYGTCIERSANSRINDKRSKPVLQYSLEGNFIKKWPSGREIQRQLGFNQGGISNCCLGKCNTAYGYIWRYKNEVA